MSKVGSKALTTLTAPGVSTLTCDLGKLQPASAEAAITIATVDTNATVKLQYSNDGFSTVAAESLLSTFTANGTFVLPVALGYQSVRHAFSTESGGTAVTVACSIATFE